jgi:hypothetical protein
LGLGPAAIIAGSAEQASGLRGGVSSLFGYGVSSGVSELSAAPASIADEGAIAQKMVGYLAVNALPAFVTDRIREQARDVNRLDPDLAVNRSFSLATKLRIQREREVERATKQAATIAKRNVLRTAFQKMHGFELW